MPKVTQLIVVETRRETLSSIYVLYRRKKKVKITQREDQEMILLKTGFRCKLRGLIRSSGRLVGGREPGRQVA